jgi:Pretoxin HINT domain
LRVVISWQDKADAAGSAAAEDAYKALHPGWEVWHVAGDVKNALEEGAKALYDEARTAEALAEFGVLEAKALGLEAVTDTERGLAAVAAEAARGAVLTTDKASRIADSATHYAEMLSEISSEDEAIADQDYAAFEGLGKEYAATLVHKAVLVAKVALKGVAKAAKVVAKAVAKVAVVVAKTAYKASGAQAVVSCVTDPKLSSCVQAAITVATVVGTGGEGAVADVAIDAAEDAAESTAEEAGGNVAEDAGKDAAESCTVGGASFTASTKVLLASGAAIPISQLQVGDKVLATNTKTGKTQPETVTAVLVHHDSDLYDLRIKNGDKTAVIDTTSNHLFWVPGADGHRGRWAKAGSLKYGTHLRTPGGSDTAVVTGGWIPRQRDGWMWDLTVPGNNDHDFYVAAAAAIAALVHNCGYTPSGGASELSREEIAQLAYQHIGEGDIAGRPSLEEIQTVLDRGEPVKLQGQNAVQLDHNGVRVIVNEDIPWRSTSYYPGR